MERSTRFAALTMCALALGFCASAQNVYEQVVNDQLDIAEKEVTRIAASNGATATLIEQINGTLEDDGDDQISLTLRPNTAVCADRRVRSGLQRYRHCRARCRPQ